VALRLLEQNLDVERVGTAPLLGMLDSNREDVQNTAIDLARKYADRLDAGELVDRLIEHPHVNMRRFALELVTRHLPDGEAALAKVERFCRAILLDVWPRRREKDDVIALLTARGLRDEGQARVAARVLSEGLRMSARFDFDAALAGLVRIKLAYPAVEADVRLAEASAAGGGA
jgi:hypothetical protein